MSQLLEDVRNYATWHQRAPTAEQIERLANFRERGGLTRCLMALEAVAAEHLTKSTLQVDAIVSAIFEKCDVMDDGDGPKCVVATKEELTRALAALRP